MKLITKNNQLIIYIIILISSLIVASSYSIYKTEILMILTLNAIILTQWNIKDTT